MTLLLQLNANTSPNVPFCSSGKKKKKRKDHIPLLNKYLLFSLFAQEISQDSFEASAELK